MRAFPLFGAVAIIAAAPAASAQTPSIDARTWRPPTDATGGLVLEPVTTPGGGNWNVDALLSYAFRPVHRTIDDPTVGSVQLHPIEHLVGLDLVAGIGLGSRVSLGLSLPMALYQTGDKPLPTTVVSSGEVASSAIGDLGLHTKVSIVDDSQGGFGLAAMGTVTLPTGDTSSFMGEGSATVGARALAEYTLLVASVQASLGYTLRVDQRTWPDASVGGNTYGDVMPWTIGASLKPEVFKLDPGHRQRWDLSVRGWLPITPVAPGGTGSSRMTPAILNLADRIELGKYRDAFVLAGADVGLNDNATGVPVVRFMVGIGWAPRNHDMDNDGVPDDLDQCPELPEDKDGFEDDDGCPEIDNDDDGVLDKDDACPDKAGFPSPDPKKNGCPQPDADKDGVPDSDDACPNEKGFDTDDPKTNGCPRAADRDKDGIPDRLDRCPDQPEDKDGHDDDDGCPDPDDDGDGIADVQDACPREPGEPSQDTTRNGCPNPDRDGDTYENDVDKCPNEPETFNGVQDDDGCPDTGGKPLVTVVLAAGKAPRIVVAPGGKLAAGSVTLRAIAAEAIKHPDWTLLVAAQGPKADAALAKAGQLADELDRFAHRELAEATAWDAVKKEPATVGDVKIVVVVGGTKTAPTALPPVPKP